MNGQSAQYIFFFFTASVMVFSAAKAVGEARTLTAMAAEARSLLIGILRSLVEEYRRCAEPREVADPIHGRMSRVHHDHDHMQT
jgi:hypothetical protein